MLQTSRFTTPTSVADQLVRRISACREFPAIVSASAEGLDPLGWLAAQNTKTKLVWCDREQESPLVGAGEAASVVVQAGDNAEQVLDRCRDHLGDHASLRFYGGFSFDGTSSWPDFGAGRFLLPRVTLCDDEIRVAILDRDDVVAASLDVQNLVMRTAEIERELPAPWETSYLPDRPAWARAVNHSLDLIRDEVLEKVVLARAARMHFESAINPIHLTAKIAPSAYDCHVFCFQFGPEQAFLGATPERLFKRRGRQIRSEAVAGTRPRGATEGEDQRLAYDLLTSEKDQLEHDIVRKSIRQKLHRLVDHLEADSHASVLRLANKQHLCSAVEGRLKPGVSDGELLNRLHPTPAVGGYPLENALSEIARLEPFNRGWYSAPLGWVGRDEAEFVVGIRSGLLLGRQLTLFSGAGIVQGSEPEQEWAELENKIRDFVNVLGGSRKLDRPRG